MSNETVAHRSFWQFNLGHLLVIIGLLGSVTAAFVTYDRGIYQTKSDQKSLTDSVASLAETVKRMDEHGTRASQEAIKTDHAITESNARRLDNTDRFIQSFQPRLERIDSNLDIMTQWIQRQDKNLILPHRNGDSQ